MLVTVSVYVPRPPLVLNLAMPAELVVALCTSVPPPGMAHVAETTAPDTTAAPSVLTATLPVTLTFLRVCVADKLIAVLRSTVLLAALTTIVVAVLARALALSVTVSVAV